MQTNRASSRIVFLVFLLALCAPAPAALAWGPHGEITRAAQEVLPEREKAAAYFGGEWRRLPDYSLMPDLLNSIRDDFFPNDFLLWPGMRAHTQHMMPKVVATCAPHFQRALQALRTETPANAARWIGSLVHYVEDSGAPDFWNPITASQKLKGWESDSIRVRSNTVYRVGIADPQPGVRYGVRWRSSTRLPKTVFTNVVCSADIAEREITATSYAATAQLLVLTDQPLTNAVRRVWLVPAQ